VGWLTELKRDNEAKHQIFQLQCELEDTSKAMQARTAGMKTGSDEYRQTLAEFSNDASLIIAAMKQIQTDRMLDRASRWNVAYPSPPFGTDDDTDMWAWHPVHGRHYLTDEGLSHLRREVYREWEMWSRPWLSWGAIAISIVSLLVAIFKP
jgi:hypothetical protein